MWESAMMLRTLRFGSPKLYGCWLDEDDNRLVKAAAASAHRLTWHARVLDNLRIYAAGKRRRVIKHKFNKFENTMSD